LRQLYHVPEPDKLAPAEKSRLLLRRDNAEQSPQARLLFHAGFAEKISTTGILTQETD
jgi:hypothetical protein